MATADFSTYFLYRWRYVIGYTLIGLLLAGLLLFAGLAVPNGLSDLETQSVIRSASLSFSDPSSLAVTNLPYYLLQAGIFSLWDVSNFTIKLPSLILALFSALGLIMLLRRWFTPNIAVLASLIAITTGQFLFIGQQGNPSILYVFWPVVLLLLGTQITRKRRFKLLWKILFAITAALSLYTPLSIYPLIAITLAVALHPHLRAIIRRLSRPRLVISATLAAIIIAPLVYLTIINPQLGPTLLGAPTVWPPSLVDNLMTVVKQYFLFWEPSTTTLMTPVFGLASAIIIGLGLYRLFRTRETTRSYLIILWLAAITPVLILNPQFTSVTFTFSVLLIAAGLTSLISYWYRLFPLNPYARILGLVPLVILVAVLIGTGLARYTYGYHYDPRTAPLFSRDLTLLPEDTRTIVTSGEKETDFYKALSKYRTDIVVTDSPTTNKFTTTKAAQKDYEGYEVSDIITNPFVNDSDRFYIYKKQP